MSGGTGPPRYPVSVDEGGKESAAAQAMLREKEEEEEDVPFTVRFQEARAILFYSE